MRTLKVTDKEVGLRADVFLVSQYPDFTRATMTRLFDESKVSVGGRAIKVSHKLKSGEKLSVDDELLLIEPEVVELPVVYEDVDVVVINKPAGMLTHSKGAINLEPTVASFLVGKITDKDLRGNRAGIVHRLDRRTSGLIIGAKSGSSQKYLQKQFAERRTAKTYIALVEGWPEPTEAVINIPLERNPKRPQTFRVGSGGKPSETRYKVLKPLEVDGRRLALVELKPVTGRTHQLRVHLAYIGHPIVGDGLYGNDGDEMLLHAASLEIRLPNGRKEVFVTDLPEHFKRYGR